MSDTGVLDLENARRFIVAASAAPDTALGVSQAFEMPPGVYEVRAGGIVVLAATQDAPSLQGLRVDSYSPVRIMVRGQRCSMASLSGAAVVVTWTPVLPLEEAWRVAKTPAAEAIAAAGGTGARDL